MFCIKCGKKAVMGNFCSKCFLEQTTIIHENDFTLNVCSCENVVEKIKNRLKDYKVISIRRSGGGYVVEIEKEEMFGTLLKKERKKIKIFIKRKKCERCIKIAGGYSEAVIQLRGNAVKLFDKLDKRLISRVEKTTNGVDVKMLSRKDAKRYVKLFKDLKFEIKSSFKLIGMKKGKRIVKDVFLVRG